MVRATSIESYKSVEDSGLSETLRDRIYKWLSKQGPASKNEIATRGFPTLKTDSINPRLAELRRLGLVRELETRPCTITGRKVIIWAAVPLSALED